jgi:hypothetical protein
MKDKNNSNKMYIKLFEEWEIEFVPETKKKKKKDGNIDNYEPPEHVVQPHHGDPGYEIVKKEFDKMKTYFKPGIKA